MQAAVWGGLNRTETEDGKLQDQRRRSHGYLYLEGLYNCGRTPYASGLDSVDSSVVRRQRLIEQQQARISQEKIVINVSGQLYETFGETLKRFPNTLLGCSETRQAYYETDKQEYYFGRRSVSSFNAILFYYQSNGLLSRPADVDSQTFYKEICFFQLEDSVVKRFLEFECLTMNDGNQESRTLAGGKVWKFLEYPSYSTFAKVFAVFSALVICLSVVVFCGETMRSIRENSAKKSVFHLLEITCVAWFTFEYILRVAFSPNHKKFCLSAMGCIDVMAFVPFLVITLMAALNYSPAHEGLCCFVPVLKLLRVVRVLKFSRYVYGMNILGETLVQSTKDLFLLFWCLLTCSIFFASFAYLMDASEADTQIPSIPDGIWFVLITLTNVGYGDIVPVSALGKVNACLCIIVGVIVLTISIPVIVWKFTTLYRMHKEYERRDMLF